MNNSYDRDETSENPPVQFQSPEEYTTWCVENLAKAITNLSNRISNLEAIVHRLPPPGADMIQYKIPGQTEYSNIKELLDDIYSKLESK
jgi:hypothetical protein